MSSTRNDRDAGHRDEGDRGGDQARYRALVENLPAVIYQVAPDDDRRTMYVSSHVETALGYSRAEWLEQPDIWMELLHPDDREQTLAAHDLHNETGRPWSREYRLIASDGTVVWFRDVANLVRDEDGRPLHWLGVQLDITELKEVERELRKARDGLERRVAARTAELEEANELMTLEIGERRRAESELRDAEQRYRALAEQIPAVTYVWEVNRPEGAESREYTSPRIEQLLGYTVEEWHDPLDFWMSRLHPDDRQAVLAATMRSEITGEPFAVEYRYLHKDGHIVWVTDNAILVATDEWSRPHLFQGVMSDVTARKEAEAKAAETELRYRDLTEQVPGVIYIAELNASTPGYRLRYASPQLTAIFGYELEDWADTDRWLATVHPEDRERVQRVDADVADTGGFDMEYRIFHGDGGVRWVRDRAHVLTRDELGRPTEIQGLLMDVTDARRIDRDRREVRRRYRSLVEAIPAMTYLEYASPDAPRESRFAYMSPQVEEILGFTPEETMSDPLFLANTLHPDDLERVMTESMRVQGTEEPFDEEFRQRTKDGRYRWIHDRAVLVRDDDGSPVFWHGVATDITARKEAEQNLRLLDERYRTLVEQIPAVTFIEEIGGPPDETWFSYLSPQAAEIFGRSAEELLANPSHLAEYVHPDDRDRVYAANARSEETGEPFNEEFRIVRPDGRILWLDSRAVLVRDDEGRPRFWQGVAIDVTAHRELETRYRDLASLMSNELGSDATS
ncbi:MAG TPA: PAS domain-containing protein [Actinomycetota bacterium]|jgi:PAS domain S-box-containing protein|nr:PAS domain-containing protein [Actinomycetota bacterium]